MPPLAALNRLGQRYLAVVYEAIATSKTSCPHCHYPLRRIITASNQFPRAMCTHCFRIAWLAPTG